MQSDGGILSAEVPSSQMTSCDKLTKTKYPHQVQGEVRGQLRVLAPPKGLEGKCPGGQKVSPADRGATDYIGSGVHLC